MMPMTKAARTRWHMDNETFGTLKSESGGYNPGHSQGYGKHHLTSVMAYPCMPVFLMEQVCRKCMREEMRLILARVILNDWEIPCRLPAGNDQAMDGEIPLAEPEPDSMYRKCPGPDFGVTWKSEKGIRGQGPSISLSYPFCRSCKSGVKKINGNYCI